MARNTHQTVLEILRHVRRDNPLQFTSRDLLAGIMRVAGADPRTVKRYFSFMIQFKYVRFVENENYEKVKGQSNALDLVMNGSLNLILTTSKQNAERLSLWIK